MIDQELYIIKDIITEAYKIDTNITPFIEIEDNKMYYILLDLWCKDTEDQILLLKIILKVIDMFPSRMEDITSFLLCRTSLINTESLEVSILCNWLNDSLSRRLH